MTTDKARELAEKICKHIPGSLRWDHPGLFEIIEKEIRQALQDAAPVWRPIAEAPRDGTEIILGAFYKNGLFDAMIGSWTNRAFRPCVGQTGHPTHFMLLPQPPQEGSE